MNGHNQKENERLIQCNKVLDNMNKSLEKRLVELRKCLDDVENNNKQNIDSKKDLEKQLKDSIKEISNLKLENENLKKNVNQEQDVIKKISIIEAEKKTFEKYINEKRTLITNLENEKDVKIHTIETLKTKFLEAEEKIKLNLIEIQEMNKNILELKETIKNKDNKIMYFNDEIIKSQGKINEMIDNNDMLRTGIDKKVNNDILIYSSNKIKLHFLRYKLDKFKIKISDLEKESINFLENEKTILKDISRLQVELKTSLKDKAMFEDEIINNKIKKEEFSYILNDKVNKVECMVIECENKADIICNLKNDNKSIQNELYQERNTCLHLCEENKNFKDKITNLNEKYKEFESVDVKYLYEKNKELENDLDKALSENKTFKNKILRDNEYIQKISENAKMINSKRNSHNLKTTYFIELSKKQQIILNIQTSIIVSFSIYKAIKSLKISYDKQL